MKPIYVTRASLPPYEEYIEAIKPLWSSHWITNMGGFHQKLEKELEKYLEVPMISLMVNGHMSLELAIQSFGFPAGAEVITTPFTFISTTHAIVRNRLKPVFCDVKESDGTIDEEKIEKLITPRTVAIVPVHIYGNICAVDEIQEIADKYGLKVIYDAAHAFGEKYKGIGIGNYGDLSVFSFHATKVFNTIEGGAVVGRDMEKYSELFNLKNFGIRGEELVVAVGANAKMNEFAAIMGLCNLEHIQDVLKKRARISRLYRDALADYRNIRVLKMDSTEANNYAYFPILFESENIRNEIYNELAQNSIYTRKYFYPITADQACFKNGYRESNLETSRSLAARVLCLPIYEDMDKRVINRIDRVISHYFGGY